MIRCALCRLPVIGGWYLADETVCCLRCIEDKLVEAELAELHRALNETLNRRAKEDRRS